MAKGWKLESIRHSMAARGMSTAPKTFVEIAGVKLTYRQIALWHAEQARLEVKKKNPDYTAINYHLTEALIYNKFKPVVVPRSMLSTEDSRRYE